MKAFEIRDQSVTVTYNSDDSIPTDEYGDRIAIVVTGDASVEKDRIKDTITIRIGENTFRPEDVEMWKRLIDQAKKMADTF